MSSCRLLNQAENGAGPHQARQPFRVAAGSSVVKRSGIWCGFTKTLPLGEMFVGLAPTDMGANIRIIQDK